MSVTVAVTNTTVNVTTQPVIVSAPDPGGTTVVITAGIQGQPGTPGAGGGSLTWQIVDEGQVLEVGNGYQYDGLALGIFTLPPTPDNGDRIALYRIGSANWQLQENDDQFIYVIGSQTTTGTGYLQSMELGGGVELAYTGAGRWECTDIAGNIEVI